MDSSNRLDPCRPVTPLDSGRFKIFVTARTIPAVVLLPLKDLGTIQTGRIQTVTETRLVDLLDSTLWNRKLALSSERLVSALVHQIFHRIKEHFLVSTELKFNSFLLMPVVDKLPALLKEDPESVFGDDLDSIFNISQLKLSLGQRKREMEIELKRKHLAQNLWREHHLTRLITI